MTATRLGWERTRVKGGREYSYGWGTDIPFLPRIGWNSVSIWASIARYRIGYTRRHSRESMGATPLKRRPRYESLEEELAAIDAMKPPPGKVWSSSLILDGSACYDPRPILRGVAQMKWIGKDRK